MTLLCNLSQVFGKNHGCVVGISTSVNLFHLNQWLSCCFRIKKKGEELVLFEDLCCKEGAGGGMFQPLVKYKLVDSNNDNDNDKDRERFIVPVQ